MEQKPVSFSKLYENRRDSIYRLCSIMVHDKGHADDLFQEVMLSIWKGLKNFRYDAKIDTWIYRIVNNCSINFNLKEQRNKERVEQFEGFGDQSNADTHQKEELFEKISQLKSADRMILGLYLEGYAYKEIAEVLGMTNSNVGVRINRIKSELKTLYFQN